MRSSRRRTAVVVLIVASLALSFARTRAAELEGLDEAIAETLEAWKVPGLALAVFKDDKVILSKGYGYRDVENKLPVTPKTLFAIGSITKSFTATVLGTLADEGAIEWDAPVRRYLPDFELHDTTATLGMTPRDLVTHRSGLPRHDLLWYGTPFDRAELYERLRHLEPSKSFREVFQYNNLMFMTAGMLAGKVAGRSWEALVRERIFEPLGMAGSNFSVTESQKAADFALPYALDGESSKRVPFRNIDAVGPAGSINSNVDEMIRYVRLHMDRGKVGDRQLLSEGNARAMQSPQMAMPGGSGSAEVGSSSYGLGFIVSSYRGHDMVQHGGGIDGFISLLAFLPRERIGVIALTNRSGANPVPMIAAYRAFDLALGLEPIDWLGRTREQWKKQQELERSTQGEDGGTPGTSPSHPLANYAGTYEHPAYGAIRVELEDGALRLRRFEETVALRHLHYDVFKLESQGAGGQGDPRIVFSYDKSGEIDRVSISMEPTVDDAVFKRTAGAPAPRALLEELAGEYRIGPITARVWIEGDAKLMMEATGQGVRALIHAGGTTFRVEGAEGVKVEFQRDDTGAIIAVAAHMPTGVVTAKRVMPAKPKAETATGESKRRVQRF